MNTLWQFVKYCIVGVSTTLIGLLVYYTFIWIRNDIVMAMSGLALGWALGVVNAFLWNRFIVFKERTERWHRVLAKVYLGYALNLLMSLFLTYVQIQLLNISAVLAPLINIAITTPINFCISKFWVFKKSGR